MLTAGFILQVTYTLYMYTKYFTESNDKHNIKLTNVFFVLVVSFSGGGSTSLTRKFLRTQRVTKSMTN